MDFIDLRYYVPLRHLDVFARGLLLTIRLVALSCTFGLALGIIGAFLKTSKNRILCIMRMLM